MEELTLEVEREHPSGKHFGSGEGILWQVVKCNGMPEM